MVDTAACRLESGRENSGELLGEGLNVGALWNAMSIAGCVGCGLAFGPRSLGAAAGRVTKRELRTHWAGGRFQCAVQYYCQFLGIDGGPFRLCRRILLLNISGGIRFRPIQIILPNAEDLNSAS
jgi:hypothetical protein